MEESNEGDHVDNQALPNNSILFIEDNNDTNNDLKEEIFNSVIYTKMVSEHKKLFKETKKNIPIKGKLKNLMACGCCKRNLRDLYFCPICKGYACKRCFYRDIHYLYQDLSPCPLCKKLIKRSKLKNIPFLRTIKEIIEDDENEDNSKLIKFNPIDIIQKCDIHNSNKIWAYCIDCNRKMCPVCYSNENKAHSQHKCINYEKYLDLNLFFGNSFKDIKNFVINTENVIKDIQKLYNDLDDQKNNLLKFSLDIYDKIDKSFNEQQVKINDIISNLTQKISKLNNFRKNIKKYVTQLILIGYSEFGNMDELKKIIKERIEKINIELKNDNKVKNIEKDYYKKDVKFAKLVQKLDISKKKIISKGITMNIQGNDNYILNVGASEDDVFFYLNINKVIDGKQNNNPYLVTINITDLDKNSKTFYLEFNNEDNNYITYNSFIPKNELAKFFKKGEINVRIDYLKLI